MKRYAIIKLYEDHYCTYPNLPSPKYTGRSRVFVPITIKKTKKEARKALKKLDRPEYYGIIKLI